MIIFRLLPPGFFLILVFFPGGFRPGYAATQNPRITLNERVLVVYNKNVPESLEVADYYLTKRDIPAANKCAITPTKADSIDWYNYEINVKKPIQSCLNALGKDRILYIVFAYQTPYKIFNVPTGSVLETRAVDQFVADLWNENIPDIFEITNHPYFAEIQSQGNVYPPFISFADYRNQPDAQLMYSVWRLDAATKDVAKGLVDQALLAEANGLQGQACFDRGFAANGSQEDWQYNAANFDLTRAADFARKAGISVTEDEQEAEFGTAPAPLRCENVALYSGWYSFNHYNDAFSWATGAIGFHLDSGSALDPRSGANWSANALLHGITVTSGAVNEPYLEGLPHPDGVFRNLLEGANVGDAFLRNTAWLQWMIINLGDPLYRPFPGGRAPFNLSSFAQNSLSLDSTFMVGGKSATATVTSSSPAPVGGLEVKLTTSRPGVTTVSESVRIPVGATTAKFPVTTTPTTNYQPAVITATFNNEAVANTLTVAPLLSFINFSPNIAAADTVKSGTIFLNDYAPSGGVTISLTSDNPTVAPVPSTVFIAEGNFKATFTVLTGVVAAETSVIITASHNGAMETASLTVVPIKRRIVPGRRMS